MISEDYVVQILKALEQKPDVVCFKLQFTQEGVTEPIITLFSKDYTFNLNHEEGNKKNVNIHVRMPNHLCPVKRELALKAGFESKNFGEDTAYGISLRGKHGTSELQAEVRIDKILYYYNFSQETSETHIHNPLFAMHEPAP